MCEAGPGICCAADRQAGGWSRPSAGRRAQDCAGGAGQRSRLASSRSICSSAPMPAVKQKRSNEMYTSSHAVSRLGAGRIVESRNVTALCLPVAQRFYFDLFLFGLCHYCPLTRPRVLSGVEGHSSNGRFDVSREHRRAETDRLDTELLKRARASAGRVRGHWASKP